MIFLTLNPNRALSGDATPEELATPAVQREIQALIDMYSAAQEKASSYFNKNMNFTVSHMLDQDGNEYDEIAIRAEAIFKRDGEQWIAGGGFAFNATQVVNALEAMLVK